MSENPPLHAAARARPVAEAPVDALIARADELARGWAIALILVRPLDRIGELPLERLSREGPALCAQAIRALASDIELERMTGAGVADGREDSASARGLAALAGARDPASAVEAVEALRGVLWEALLDELRWPLFDRSRPRQVADLADRLAYVCATALAVTVAVPVAADQATGEQAGFGAAGSAQVVSESHRAPRARQRVVMVDEREEIPAAGSSIGHPAATSQAPGSASAREAKARPLPWEMPFSSSGEPGEASQTPSHPFGGDTPPAQTDPTAAAPSQTVVGGWPTGGRAPAPYAAAEPEIHIRDERGEEGPAAWIGSIGRELERFERDRLPFAVLLVELGDPERLRRAALPAGILSLTSQVERVLGEGLQLIAGSAGGRGRRAGWLTCERPGRYWLLAPETDVFVAREFAEWVARAVRPLASRRRTPIKVTIGMAVCPDDGRDAAALAAHADAALSVA
jgi:hypothetical protein